MKNFRKQAKRVKDLRWQIVRWEAYYNKNVSFPRDRVKIKNRIKYYKGQYKVALKQLKTM